MGGLSSLAGGISDVVGGIGDIVEDNAGAIIGGIVAYNTFGAAYGFGLSAGLGSAAGSYVQHGDTGRAIGDGLMGATVGSIAAPTVSATGGGAVSNAGPNPAAPPQPSGQSFMNQTSGGAVTPDTLSQVNAIPLDTSSVYNGTPTAIGPDVANTALPIRTPGIPAGANAPVTAPTSYFDQAINYVKDNPLTAAGGPVMAYGALGEEKQPERPDIKNEYDEFRACLASGRGDCVPPSSLYPSGREHLRLGQQDQGRPRVNPNPMSNPQREGIGGLPSTMQQVQPGVGQMYNLMDELNPRSA